MYEPEDFEIGDTPLDVEVSPNPGMVLCIRFTADEAERLDAAAEARQMLITKLAHDLVLNALGAVPTKPPTR